MSPSRRYTDQELATAVGQSNSWRGTLRRLGLTATSARSIQSVRAHADRCGLDYGHFRGQRAWTVDQLVSAVRSSASWEEVAMALSQSPSMTQTLKGHAARLEFETKHLNEDVSQSKSPQNQPALEHLHRAGSLLAAGWFTLCGYEVSWPLEPCRYDLLVHVEANFRRVQVKTTSTRTGATWKVYLSTARRTRVTYGPDEIDEFFIIDGDLDYYRVPFAAVGGLQAIHLSKYRQFRVPRR